MNSFSTDPAPNSLDHQAISYFENTIAIWDLRMFDKPVDLINEPDSILKVQWCPTKCGKLAVLSKNQPAINIYTIRSVNASNNLNVIEDENAPRQILIEKTSRKFSTPTVANKERELCKSNSNSLSPNNFCWYTFDTNKILISSNSIMNTLSLSDIIVLSFAPTTGDFCWSSNLGKLNMIENIDRNEFDFINELKDRAKVSYGLKYEIISMSNGNASSVSSSFSTYNSNNILTNNMTTQLSLALNSAFCINTLIRSDFIYNTKTCSMNNKNTELSSNTKYLWQWFESINRLFEYIIPLNPRSNEFTTSFRNIFMDLYWTRYSGLRSLLEDFILKRPNFSDQQQSHDDRFKIISYNLCNWEYKESSITKQFFINLESSGQIERAACLAFLTQHYEQSLEILDNSSKSDPRYGCLWIALKYFYDEQVLKDNTTKIMNSSLLSPTQQNIYLSPNKTGFHNPSQINSSNDTIILSDAMVKECNNLIENFNNPYLKALFNFILNREDSIDKILRDRTIMLQDRIALSVYFMYNQYKQRDLLKFFDYLIEEECFKNADLHGVLLTGLNVKSIDLFQAFIEKFGDIQTVSLAIIHTPYTDVLQSKQVQYWISCYRELLNKFKLWEMRAEFDLFKMKLIKSQNILPSSNNQTETNGSPVESHISSKLSNSNLPSFIRQNSQQNVTSQKSYHLSLTRNNQPTPFSIHLACNKCGKNLLEKTSLSIDTNSSSQLLYRQPSYYSNPSLNHAVSNLNLNLVLNQKSFKQNDQSINGCLNCARFLPQCVICLKLMKINMTPSSVTVHTNHPGHLNRSQSLYATLPMPNFSSNSTEKLLLQSKSPTIQINKSQTICANIPHLADLPNVNFISDLEQDEIKQQEFVKQQQQLQMHRSKSSLHAENLVFLSNSKFGNWFSWCQSCKHGGHINCLINWFRNHEKCPFLHCKCQCLNIDNHIN